MKWTDEEELTIIEYYPNMTVRDLKKRFFPNRTVNAIRQKIVRMRENGASIPRKIGNLRYGNYYYCVKHKWILKEDAITINEDKRPRCPYCHIVLRLSPS